MQLGFSYCSSIQSNGFFDTYSRQLNACQNGFIIVEINKNNGNITISVEVDGARVYTAFDPRIFSVSKRPSLVDVDSAYQKYSVVECSIFEPVEP